jgi:hypothetical protein
MEMRQRTPTVAAAPSAVRVAESVSPRRAGDFNRGDDDVEGLMRARGRPAGKRIIKTVLAAIVLFAIGSVMLWQGLKALPIDKDRGIAMIVVGAIAFLPGSYASFILLGAWCRWEGYSYQDLPSYDE